MILSDERQKTIVANANSGVLGVYPTSMGNIDVAIYTRNNGPSQQFKKNFNNNFNNNFNTWMYCDFCKMKNHTIEDCYKLNGYPQDSRPPDAKYKKRPYNSMNENNHKCKRFNKDGNSSAYNMGQSSQGTTSRTNVGMNQLHIQGMQMGPYPFSNEQYEKIVGILKNTPADTTFSTTGISTTLLASKSVQEWIIDTGATNHMDLYSGKVKEIDRLVNGVCILSQSYKNIRVALVVDGTEIDDKVDVHLWHRRLGHMSTTTLHKYFLNYVRTQLDRNVKIIRSDNGTEFVNFVCGNLFKNLGIVHQISCAYTSQQNGVAERKHRHILDITRAIIFEGKIPVKFWGLCADCSLSHKQNAR
ncbi:uncharacterized protein LOC132601659 [Lycium barbarum]|uniref:uncharacterized protein LOC132601659 n=1 Tax=Lycium barbarum TaxID=112863 RepID=UPI00293EFCFF|nr:uncharacterized protein LOC132601659 [Lycium barbarum]